MAFFDDLFGRLTPRPPIDVFGGQGLDAFGELMGDGSDALQPITPFGPSGGFLGGLGSLTSSSPSFWQMPQLGGGIGAGYQGAYSPRLPIKENTFTPARPGLFSKKPAATTGTATPGATPTGTTTPSSGAPAGTRDTVLRWLPLVQKYSQKYGVPAEVILASIDSESGGDPKAVGPDTGGQGRAYGLLQGMQMYWGKNGDLTDPDYNLDTIVGQLMKPAWDKYQSAAHVRAVTYGGPNAIDSAGNIKGQLSDAGIPGWTISKDVARYLPKVEAYKQYLQGQQQPAPAPATPEAAQGVQAAAIAEATKHVGKPYLLAAHANNPAANAWDCSGLVQWSFKTAGVALPRTAQQQYDATQRVTAAEVRPGDLVFFHSTYNAGTPVSHVGIALGNGQMMQAGSNGVGVVDLNTEYWKNHLYGFGRVA